MTARGEPLLARLAARLPAVGRALRRAPALYRLVTWLTHPAGLRRRVAPLRRVGCAWTAVTLRLRRRVVVVYDLASSPMTYGDFLYVALIGRFLQAAGARAEIAVLDDELRADTRELEGLLLPRLEQFEELWDSASRNPGDALVRTTHAELATRRAASYPPRRAVSRRAPAYDGAFRDLRWALGLARPRVRERFLLRGAEFAGERPDGPYVVVAVRTASAYRHGSDASREETGRVLEAIERRLPGAAVYLASDAAGTETARLWSLPHPRLGYVHDHGKTFAGDLGFALGARCFVQLRGGGLFVGPLFSREVATFLCTEPIHEMDASALAGRPWRPSWAHPLTRWCWPVEGAWAELDSFLADVAEEWPS